MPQGKAAGMSAQEFSRLVNIVKVRSGFRLDIYKEQYIRRRIDIRQRACRCSSAHEYGNLLVRDRDEMERLLQVLTVTVSHFFRNPSTFDALRSDVLPMLFERALAEGRDRLRIWCVGCAEGEEPYSLAILLQEHFPDRLRQLPVEILATDVSRPALARAAAATYQPESLKEVPAVLRDRHFQSVEGQYRLAQPLRSMVLFRHLDLSLGSGYPASDLILCRNVLIYFEREHQERLLAAFAGTLGHGGVLVLGKSEVLPCEARQRFRTISPSERMYCAI